MSYCHWHETEKAVANCVLCGYFTCEGCRILVAEKNYCKTCAVERFESLTGEPHCPSPHPSIPDAAGPIQPPTIQKPISFDSPAEGVYKGVRGWLTFLSWSLMLGPFLGVMRALNAGIYTDRSIILVLDVGLIITCFAAGERLWYIRPRAVAYAKVALCCVFVVGVGFAFVAFAVSSIEQKLLCTGIATPKILYSVTWYLYLKHSKRVRDTYLNE